MEDFKHKIKVLWIDDNPEEFNEFLDDAYDHGLDITVRMTVNAGLLELKNPDAVYEAIILDANCKISDEIGEVPHLAALSHSIVSLYMIGCNLPWFVYTGGGYEGADALKFMIPQQYREWDSQQWYNKPDDELLLFDAIRHAVATREETMLKDKYPEAFNVCASQQMMALLKRVNTKEFETDDTVPNTIREDICIPLCTYLHEKGIYPHELPQTTPNWINDLSRFLGNDKNHQYVPIYIQRMFHFLSEYANQGSHNLGAQHKVRGDIASGKARHLNRTAVDALLNIMSWCSSFPFDDAEAMKPIHEFFCYLDCRKQGQNTL